MKKKRNSRKQMVQTEKAPKKAFSIVLGKPEPILTTHTDYNNIWYDNDFDHWTPPIDREALAQLVNLNGQHGGVIYARHNMVASDYIGGGLTHEQLKAAVFNYFLFGDVAILKIRNGWGDIVALDVLPSLYLRRRKDGDFVISQEGEPLIYTPDEIIYIKMYDPKQQVYGLPDYIGGIHATLLNSEATIFRRRYYHNGAHTGGMIYCNDPNMTDEVEEQIIQKLSQSKGIGNFETMFVSVPNGDPDGIKFIPVGDISANDEFSNVKSVSAQDILNAHRFPAGLAGIIPGMNSGGLGDPLKAREAYGKDEVIPVQKLFMNAVNEQIGRNEALKLSFHQNISTGNE